MLGKLLKHEIRHSARYTMAIYGAAFAAMAVTGLSLLFDSGWLGAISCGMLYIIGFAAVVTTLVSIIKNFNDTLFGRQGYLTLTLPVKGSELLISKVLVSFLWIVASFGIMGLTFYVIFVYGKERSGGTMESMWEIISVSGILDMLPSKTAIIEFIAVVVILAISTIITYVGYVYFTVTVANTRPLQNHPKLYGGLIFFGIMSFVNTLGNVLSEYLPLTINVSTEKVFFSFTQMGADPNVLISYGIGGTILSGLVAVGLLFATGYIIENKVNIK
ncbi:MAG: hypothetical protein IKJ70_02455 [Clostridia bacterium]|nr:hypothetical protein [Clostridia bacterium]